MTVAIKIDPGVVHLPFEDQASFPIELDLLRMAKIGRVRNVRINDLSPLPPQDLFRKAVMDYARLWVKVYAKQGIELASPEAEMRVWGPYRPRDRTIALSSELRATGYSDPLAHARLLGVADFLLVATFLRPRTYTIEHDPDSGRKAAAVALALYDERERQAEYQ